MVDGTNIPYAGRNDAAASNTVIALPYDGTGNPSDFTTANAAYVTQTNASGPNDVSQTNGTGPRNLYRRTRVSEVAMSRTAATIERQLAAHRRGEFLTAGEPISLFTNPNAASGGRNTRGGAQEVRAYVVP